MDAHRSRMVFSLLLMLWSMTDSSYILLRGSLELYLPTGESTMATAMSVKCRVHGQSRCLPLSLRSSPQLHGTLQRSSSEEGTNGVPAMEYGWHEREQAGPCSLLSSQSRPRA